MPKNKTPIDREYQINPLVTESLVHNSKTLSNLHSLTGSLFGVTAGILGLESYYGFLLYLLLATITTILFYVLKIAPESLAEGRPMGCTGRFYRGAMGFWTSGITGGASGFVLTWTLFYGLVRA